MSLSVVPMPVPLTPLIGRRREIELLSVLLAQPEVRLVTLTGTGGVGKTRIAVHLAWHPQAVVGFDDVAFVSLAALRDPGHALPAIAHALGLQDRGDRPPLEHLSRALATRRLLLILDNLEHLLACVPQLTELLSACPRLTILATSREALRIRGEREVPVPPLPLPAQSDLSSLADVRKSEAITLLVQRAQAVMPDFELTVDNVPTIVQICRRLDGLPLAIELAAARVKMLPPDGLLSRLDHRLTLLTGGARDLPERHQTLRATLDWSYDLLSTSEQHLFRSLSVFPANWTIEAAETVLGALLDISVLDGIASLLDKSLVVRSDHTDGSARYQMLETVREFAAEQLAASGELDTLYQHLTDWGLVLFGPDLAPILGAEPPEVVERVTPEIDNLRAAVQWGIERYPPARQLALQLGWHEYTRGFLSSAATLVERALTAATDDPPLLRINLLSLAGFVAFTQGKYQLALQYAARGEALATDAMLPSNRDGFLILRGRIATYNHEYAEAEDLLERAIELLGPPERSAVANHAQSFLATALYRAGKLDRAAEVATDTLAVARVRNDDFCASYALLTMARIASDRGDLAGAVAAFTESARIGSSFGNVRQIAWCMWGIAVSIARFQHLEPAVTLLVVVTTLQEQSGAPDLLADGPTNARRVLAELQEQLPAETFDAALQAGQGMTTEQAIEFASTLSFPSTSRSLAEPSPYGLTPREMEILRLLVDDHSSREMAEQLFISQRTVTTHITNIFNKLGVNSRAAAVALALRQGLV